jgi:alkylation response protein AidB-like acyl-CoA dehydrogenase
VKRDIFDSVHDEFRATARAFYDRECAPHAEKWEREGLTDRAVWPKAGALGLLGWEAPEEFGGQGITDFRFNAIMVEEFYASGTAGIGFALQNDLLASYLVHLTNEEQQKRWLPGYVAGEIIAAVAMSEPAAGSDLAGIKTTAVRDGDDYIINGAKTFISSGILADLVVTAVKTTPDAGHKGISLIAVERDTPGFTRGRKLDKIGLKSADTAELFFHDVRVPHTNLIGEENRGFYHLMRNLPAERLSIAVNAVAHARRALELTTAYAHDRQAFGQPIGTFQVNRHAIAEMTVLLDVMQVYVDRCTVAANAGQLTAEEAAGAKLFATESQWQILDRCLQLHGGYGYVNEYEIARLWRDARVQRLYGGTSEIMRDLIGRKMGF